MTPVDPTEKNVLQHENNRISAYFYELLARLGATQTADKTVAVCVAHMVPNSIHFLPALNRVVPIALLLPKPKSAQENSIQEIAKLGLREHELSRLWAAEAENLIDELVVAGYDGYSLVFIDIGGYFAPSLSNFVDRWSGTVLGVLEGTENGALAYEKQFGDQSPPVPVATVARSPLKLPEDHLVGASIVFSVEALLREHGQILQTRVACIIGFGKVGRAVASALRGRGIPTVVHDNMPVPRAEAAAQGYQVYLRLQDALAVASLVISATSNNVMNKLALADVRKGTAIASVTSRDSEFVEKDLDEGYERQPLDPEDHIVRYDEKRSDRYFWLVNDGNAPNFVHGAVIGPAIQLIEGEKLAAVRALIAGDLPSGVGRGPLRELSEKQRERVADVWNSHFI